MQGSPVQGRPEQAVLPSRSGSMLMGLLLLFMLPSLALGVPFYLYSPAHAKLLDYTMRVLSILCMAGFLAGACAVIGNLRSRMEEVLGWSERKCILLMLPFVVLGPMLFHFYEILTAVRLRLKRAAYWAFAGLLCASAQCLLVFWYACGIIKWDFRTGFWGGLCGIVSCAAALRCVWLTRRADDTPSRTARCLCAIMATVWLACQIWHANATINAERHCVTETTAAEARFQKPLDDTNALAKAYTGKTLQTTNGTDFIDCANALIDSEATISQSLPIDKWCRDNANLFIKMDALCAGTPLRLQHDFTTLTNFNQELAANITFIRAYSRRFSHAITIGNRQEALNCLKHQLWLLNTIADIPCMDAFDILNRTLSARKQMLQAANNAQFLDTQARTAEYHSLDDFDSQSHTRYMNARWGTSFLLIRASILHGYPEKHTGTIVAALQSLGGMLCSPLHYQMQQTITKSLQFD